MADKEKNNPTGIRYDKEKVEFIKKEENLPSVQKVINFLVDKYWWEKKIVPQPMPKVPDAPPIENTKRDIRDEPPKWNEPDFKMPDLKFATLLQMAKDGVEDVEEFKKAVAKAKLTPNQRDLILSKLK